MLYKMSDKGWNILRALAITLLLVTLVLIVGTQFVKAKSISRVSGICLVKENTLSKPVEQIEYSNVTEVSVPNINQDDIDLLARLITAEQGYSSNVDNYEQKAYLTGSVVINRINNSDFPNTLREVVYQSGQYECVSNGHINRDYDGIAWEIAEGLLVEGTDIPNNVLFQAEFQQGNGTYMKVCNTYYCYK